MLTLGATDLHVVLGSNGFELFPVLGKLGELDVDGGTEGSSQVGGAGCDVTKMRVVSETGHGLDLGGGSGETLEDFSDVGALLHGDDTELILFVDPDEEGLGIVVEDASALWPVTVQAASLKETVSFPNLKRQID